MAITLRNGLGRPLTHLELDTNFLEIQSVSSEISSLTTRMQGAESFLESKASVETVNSLAGTVSGHNSRIVAIENKVNRYTLLDVYNNVYKNMPNHTPDISHARIRSMNYFQSTALAIGIKESDLDEFWGYARIDNGDGMVRVLTRYGTLTQAGLLQSFIAIHNSRVYQHIKWQSAGVGPAKFYTWDDLASGRTFPDLPDRSGSFNNLAASDNVIYNHLINNSWTPFTAETIVTGWSPT